MVAVTRLDPDTGPARAQSAYAGTKAADVTITAGGTALVIKAEAVISQASVVCVNGVPDFRGQSSIAGLSVNGNAVPIQDGLIQISTVVNGSPLSMLVKLFIKETTVTGDASGDSQSLTQQAARVELLSLGGTPLATLVLGEAKVSRIGRTCDADNSTPTTPTSPNDPPTTTTTNTTTPAQPSIIFVPVPAPTDTTAGSSGGKPTTIQINGQNGGCGRLQMYFNGPGKQKVAESEYGNRIVTRGRLVNCSGKSIVGGRIDVFHIIKGRKVRIRKTGIRSRALGRLTLILPLNLTTRKIIFEYRGNLADAKVTSKQTLALTVRHRGKVITEEPGPKRKPVF